MLIVRSVPTMREHFPYHENLEPLPQPHRKNSKRWLSTVILTFLCLYIIFSYKSAKKTVFTSHHINNMNIRRRKAHITKTSPKVEDVNEFVDKLEKIALIEEMKLTTFMTGKQVTFVDQNNVNSPRQVRRDLSCTQKDGFSNASYLPFCRANVKQDNQKNENNTSNVLSEVIVGGYYYPKTCRSRHKVAFLVPYRNRDRNLAIFIAFMHPFLIKQQLEYRIFVIEQTHGEPFNRGKLFNIGFQEMQKYNDWQCVVLHDVDLLPQSDKILYNCPIYPRHMVGTLVEKAHLTYTQFHTLFGGVSALSIEHYKLINGFSNIYWGWGGEDNDMYWRILSRRLPMVRYSKSVAKYKSLPHAEQPYNNHRYDLLKFAVPRQKTDGLSSLVYKVIWTKCRPLYTHILADVNPLKENITALYGKLFS